MRQKGKRKFRNYSIREKLLVTNISIIVVMLILLGFSNYNISKKMLTRVSMESSRKIVQQLSKYLDSEIQMLDDFVVKESFESQVYKALNPVYNESSYNKRNIMKKYSNNLMSYNNHIKFVLLEDEQKKQYPYLSYNWKGIEFNLENVMDTEKAKERWGKNYWMPYDEETMIAGRAVFDENTMERVGVVSIGLDAAFFRERYQELLDEKGNDIIILNQNFDTLLCSSEQAGRIVEQIGRKYDLSGSTEREFYYENQKYIFTLDDMGENGIKVMNLINEEIISQRAVHMLSVTWYAAIAAILCAVALAAWLYRDISGNLQILLNRIRRMELGDFTAESEPSSQDEIGRVIMAFNDMSKKMSDLLENITEEKMQNKNAQLKAVQFEYDALQAKINPHFLYNTLESMNSLAKLNGDSEVADSIYLLGNYLRDSISTKEKFVFLEKEIQNIRQYVELQNISFGNRIHLEFDLDEILMEAMVPKLILQPLVENAIVHGIEPKAALGNIRVSSGCERDALFIRIEDDGVGISKEWLEQGMDYLSQVEEDSHHVKVGLLAVHKRIQILYGGEYGISIAKGRERGTMIEVRMPVIFLEEEDGNEI